MKHGRDCPDRCSQCRADAVVRKVSQVGAELHIDGEPPRRIAPQSTPFVKPRKP